MTNNTVMENTVSNIDIIKNVINNVEILCKELANKNLCFFFIAEKIYRILFNLISILINLSEALWLNCKLKNVLHENTNLKR